jgi:predicted SAM-dependent methyltransferase
VAALHVLEHSNDLDRTLTRIKDFLVPQGRIVLAVPNFESLGYQKLGMRWTWAQPPLVHIFHFTAAGLLALLRRHGFGDLEISYHERWDANIVSDVEQVERFQSMEADWGKRHWNRIGIYRRWIARRNSRLRFEALNDALARNSDDWKELSELQVVGTLSGK